MHSAALLKWWYSAGWADQVSSVFLKLQKVSDLFSIGLLFRTLFQPFRQIDTGQVRGSLDVQLRAWVDNLISRGIGAMIRSFMIFLGGLWWLFWVALGAVWLLLWPFLPVLPLLGLVLSLGVNG